MAKIQNSAGGPRGTIRASSCVSTVRLCIVTNRRTATITAATAHGPIPTWVWMMKDETSATPGRAQSRPLASDAHSTSSNARGSIGIYGFQGLDSRLPKPA